MFKLLFKIRGWKITHYLPDEIKKCVIVAAPHTSNWDFIYGMGALGFMRLSPRFAIKKEWIRFPLKRLMLFLGALSIDRTPRNGVKKGTIEAIADLFKNEESLHLIITPEGTRSRVEKWKTGFYYVALNANVPIALGFMDYKKRECGIARLIYPSGNFNADMQQIMNFYKDVTAKKPENFQPL